MPRHILRSPHRETPAHAVLKSCLKCSKEFMSLGPTNRLCEYCNERNRSAAKRNDRGGRSGTRATSKGESAS